jgi:carbon-monoxide dehydrogenase medium subunit
LPGVVQPISKEELEVSHMTEVKYFAPADLGEAVALLAGYGAKATILAGGTDLLPKINHYELQPEALVFIGKLGLDYIREENGKLLIGAATTTAKIATSDLIARRAGALADAAKASGSVAIRNSATIGGNIANASPAADLVAPLLAMDAAVKLVSSGGERLVPLHDFFLGPHQTLRKPDELLTEIQMPMPQTNPVFIKVGRRKGQTLAVVSTAVRLEATGGVCREARIVLGSMAPRPLRCTQAEALIQGKVLTSDLIWQCVAVAVGESAPITDQRATAWYRQKAGTALVARALGQAAGL